MSGGVSVTVKGADAVIAKLEKLADRNAVARIVAQNGAELQQRAQRKAQFKGHWEGKKFKAPTGTLRGSIRLDMEDGGMTARVSANTEYAEYVERGTRFMAAQPYLHPALYEQAEIFRRDLERFASGKGGQ